MYICICKGLTDRDIRRGVLRGEVACMDSLRERLGASTGCGSCALAARECLEEALAHKSSMNAAEAEERRGDVSPSPAPAFPGLGDFSMA